MSIFALILLGIVALGAYLFQLSGVQTRIVKTFTERLSTTYQTDISIRQASIDLLGNLKFYDFLILDYKKDTLFFSQELGTELESINNFLNRNYRLTTVEIQSPYLKEKTYPGDEKTNLEYFLDKLRNVNTTTKKPFVLQLDALTLRDGRYKIIESEKTIVYPIEAEFRNVLYLDEELRFSLDQLSGRLPLIGQVNIFSADFEKIGERLNLSDLIIQSDTLTAKGFAQLDLKNMNAREDVERLYVDIHFDEIESNTSNFPSLAHKLNHTPLKLQRLKISGPLSKLGGFTDLYLGNKIKATAIFSGNFKNKSAFHFQAKNIQMSWEEYGLNSLLTQDQKKLLPFVLPQKGTLSADIDIAPFEYLASYKMTSNLGRMTGNLKAIREESNNEWEGKAHMDLEGVELYSPAKNIDLKDIQATIDIAFHKAETTPVALEWDLDLRSLYWNARTINSITSSGAKEGTLVQGDLAVKDPNLEAKLRWQFNPVASSVVEGEINAMNLSQWTIASANSEAILSTNFSAAFEETEGQLRFQNFIIDNQKGRTAFLPLDFTYKTNGESKKISTNTNNALGFSVEGKFLVNDFATVTRSAFEEVVFFRPHQLRSQETAFSFSVLLKQPLIEALYPDLSTPQDLRSEGFISSLEGNSYFKMELPLLKVRNYSIEGLKLETSKNNPFFNTFLTASSLKKDGFSVRAVNLLSFNAEKETLVRLEGVYGENNEPFELNFNHQYQNNNSQFRLKNAKVSSSQGLWRFNKQKEGSIAYDFSKKRIQIQNVFAINGEQEIAVSGFYESNNAFEIDFKANEVQVEHLLPPSEKFSLSGKFTASGILGLNAQNPSNALAVKLENMSLNDLPMGDLVFGIESNSRLNAFRLNGNITKEKNKTLEFLGSIFIKEEALNLDINFDLNQFSIAFLSRLGKDKLTNVEGDLEGSLNLWGRTSDLHIDGSTEMSNGAIYLPVTNVHYKIKDKSKIQFSSSAIQMNNIQVFEELTQTEGQLNTELQHTNFKGWSLNLGLNSNRFLVYNKKKDPNALFYGQGFLNGTALLQGPTKALTLNVNGTTAKGTTLIIPWNEDKGLSDTNFIDFLPKNTLNTNPITAKISDIDEDFRGFEMNFDLDVNQNAEIEIVVDQSSGSTLSGRGAGNILIESNIDGKFNIWGDYITTTGIYNFKNLGLIDKKFKVLQGGTIVWEGDPVEAQMNLEAVYEVPGGANPALLVDNPNFNKKIPTDVKIQLQGNLLKPDDPLFEIEFPNASTVVKSEINYRLADQQRRQLQALSLLSQGVFISDVSLSVQGIANNLYEKASDVFSTLLGSSSGKLDVGVNYLKGDETPFLDTRTEDRIGVTLTTQISDKILINGKIGVPVGGVEETLIVGDVQIDFILNEDGTLKAKVFNKENEFRYLGDEIGYTQGIGLSYQVDFDNFRELIQKITQEANAPNQTAEEPISSEVEFLTKKY